MSFLKRHPFYKGGEKAWFKKGHKTWNRGKRTYATCQYCSKKFRTFPSVLKKGKGKYCSLQCKYEAGFKGKIRDKPCKECGELIQRRSTYCRSCAGSKNSPRLKGPNSPSWRGGIWPEHLRLRWSWEHKVWARKVKERDNFTCQICGKKGVILHSNHVQPFSKYPKLRFVVSNGITLCKNCHIELVNRHEKDWESYFNFNLKARGFLESEHIPLFLKGGDANETR